MRPKATASRALLGVLVAAAILLTCPPGAKAQSVNVTYLGNNYGENTPTGGPDRGGWDRWLAAQRVAPRPTWTVCRRSDTAKRSWRAPCNTRRGVRSDE